MDSLRRGRTLAVIVAALALMLALSAAGASAQGKSRKAAKPATGFDARWLAAAGLLCLGGAIVVVRTRPRRVREGIA